MSRNALRKTLAGAFTALIAATSACTDEGSDAQVTIVATTSILGDLVTDVVRSAGEVEVLLPPGVDPHEFQLAAREAAALHEADLVVANGLGLETGIQDVLDEIAAADPTRVVEMAGGAADCGSATPDDPFRNCVIGDDPHVWQDPGIVMSFVGEHLAPRLYDVDAEDSDIEWGRAAQEVGIEIVAAAEEATAILKDVPTERRLLLTEHDSFRYFARVHDFQVVGVIYESGDEHEQPSARQIQRLADRARDAGVTAIFTEEGSNGALARTVAEEIGGDVEIVALFSDSLGGPGSGGESYAEVLVTNATRVRDALTD